MKATLEFDLDEGQDKAAHLRCVKAVNMAIALWDMDQYLRAKLKHGELEDGAYGALSHARETLRDIMNDHSIDLDELIN